MDVEAFLSQNAIQNEDSYVHILSARGREPA